VATLTWDQQAERDAHAAVWAEPGDGVAESLEWIGRLPEGRVLDLGCGVGRVCIPYAQQHPDSQVLGVDSSAEMLDRAETARVEAGCRNVRFRWVDGTEIEGLGKFAAVWSMLVFQHLEPRVVSGYVMQLSQLVRAGGMVRFQFVDAALTGRDDEGPLSRPHHRDLVGSWLEAAKFDVGDVTVGGMRPTWTWMTGTRR
jgi:cyclopropane fatty-acyl-phospholipid synthase-like methyltransferase